VAIAAPDLLGEDYRGQYASEWNALIAATAAGTLTLVGLAAALELRPWTRVARAGPRLEQIDNEPAPAYPAQRQAP
jgi:hypothetical protein